MTIKELRASLNLSQASFASAIGAGLSTVAAYESGRRKPSDKAVAKIKEAFGVQPCFYETEDGLHCYVRP